MLKILKYCVFSVAVCGVSGAVRAGQTGAEPVAIPSLTPAMEAGARYGQALGVELMCLDLRIQPTAEALKGKFEGTDLAAFTAQSEKVLGMWKDALSCKHAGGPNECKLSHMWSCQEAVKEIGPQGTKIPGLIGPK